MEPITIFSTRPVNFKIYTGRPARLTVFFFTESFVHCSMHLMKNSHKGEAMDEVLKFVTPDGRSEKKRKNKTLRFLQNYSMLRPF